MRIPEVRKVLLFIASELEKPRGFGTLTRAQSAREIRKMVMQLYRRPYVRKAPTKSRSVDPALRAALRDTAARRPDLTEQEIAVRHGVTAGRVSEAIAGKRQ